MLETPDRYVNWGCNPFGVLENKLLTVLALVYSANRTCLDKCGNFSASLKLKVKPEGLMCRLLAGARRRILLEVYQR